MNNKFTCIYCDQTLLKRSRTRHNESINHLSNVKRKYERDQSKKPQNNDQKDMLKKCFEEGYNKGFNNGFKQAIILNLSE